jgi:transcriptional regulator with XRE-family HTH domain
MHNEIVKKIKHLRIEKGFSKPDMAEKLHIDLSAYSRLESGKTHSWAKHLDELFEILDIAPEDFFKGIGTNIKITNKEGSSGGNVHVENLFAENKEKSEKMELLYQTQLKDKDLMIEQLMKVIDKMK